LIVFDNTGRQGIGEVVDVGKAKSHHVYVLAAISEIAHRFDELFFVNEIEARKFRARFLE
jgi:hypothetical protein